jgi:hypothetical protein
MTLWYVLGTVECIFVGGDKNNNRGTMDSNKRSIGAAAYFKVAVGDANLFLKILNDHNATYKTNFSVKSIEVWDGVEFVLVNVNECDADDIFLLGEHHGMVVQSKRDKGEIFY